MAAIKVAVVNHDAVFLRLIELILRTDGYDPILCPSGTAAHSVISDAQPELVIVDTWLGSRDEGWALVQTLRLDHSTKTIPILILSSDPDEVRKRTDQLEATPGIRMIIKPFDQDQLLGKLDEMTKRQRPARA